MVKALFQLTTTYAEPSNCATTDTALIYLQSPPFINTDLLLFLVHNKLSTKAMVIPSAGLIGKESFPK